jgi:diguanylate cyclase (GGDEF)-like protein
MVDRHSKQFVHSEDHSIVRNLTDAIAAGALEQSAYFRHLRPDGSWLWVESKARVHGSADAETPKGKVVVLRDATDTKAAEAKLRDALERMERMAATDELTGLANRRRLNEVADIEWRRCARENLPLSALLLDADHFKLFNDRYGHQAGDDCLRAIASRIVAVARRPGDVAARYGGEEFALLMPNTDPGGALHVADRLCGLVHALGIVHEGNAPYRVVTVSIGVATTRPGDPESPLGSLRALLSEADAGLYQAKSEGRNQVCRVAGRNPG